MSKVTNQLNSIIKNAEIFGHIAKFDDLNKYKYITGQNWVTEDILNDPDYELQLLSLIPTGAKYIRENSDDPKRPDVHPNTPEQDAIEQNIIDQIINKSATNINIDGTANNIIIPKNAKSSVTINGAFQDGFTITNLSSKSVTVNNTGNPVSVIIDSDDASSLTLTGEYIDVWSNVKSVKAENATLDSITFDPGLEGKGNLSVNAVWNKTATVTSGNTNAITIQNSSDSTVLEKLIVNAPKATVTIAKGEWDEINATVADNTLIINPTVHIQKLNMQKGKAIVCSTDISDVIDEYTGDVSVYTYHAPEDGTTLTGKSGVYECTGEFTSRNCIVFGIVASGKYKYINNGHVISGNKNGICLTRSGVNVTFEGDGIWENPEGYGIWKSSQNGDMIINGGHFIAKTHAVYAEKGIIEINGGEFEVSNDDKRYVLNCLDKNYPNNANIIVKGGIFHDFDPANSMSEPGGPVSFVADGYKSVQTAENIWTVVPVDTEIEEYKPVIEETTTEEPTE